MRGWYLAHILLASDLGILLRVKVRVRVGARVGVRVGVRVRVRVRMGLGLAQARATHYLLPISYS